MAIISTANVGTQVQISWVAPSYNYQAIDQYEIDIIKSDGTYYSDSTLCGGTSLTTSCLIDMTTIIANTALSTGSLIKAVGRAHNANGWGSYS